MKLTPLWDAYARHQQTESQHNPGTLEADQAFHAAHLAAQRGSEAAETDPFFVRNTHRDARSVVIRQKRWAPVAISTVTEKSRGGDAAFDRQFDVRRGPVYRPDEIAAGRELEAEVRLAIAGIRYGDGCLTGLLAGETEQESAHRLGIPRHRVTYARGRIRSTVAATFGVAADGKAVAA